MALPLELTSPTFNHTPLPSGHEYRLDTRIFTSVRNARNRNVTEARIREALQGVSDIGPAIAETILRAHRLSSPAGGTDIASGLSTSERSNLTQANGRAGAIASSLNALT